jgi:hypothetical protein
VTGSPLINFGELSKPATVLVEKISDAVGGVFKPYQIVRVAKAQAEAEKIGAQSKIEITDLQRRAMQRFLEEEGKKQANIESITQKALPLLDPESSPDKMSDDWITNFFDKCRIVSDEEMQQLWANILAGEANSPGEFSRKTVNIVSTMDKRDAEILEKLCRFMWTLEDHQHVPLIYEETNDIYVKNGVNFTTLTHLDSLGIIRFDNTSPFSRLRLPKNPRLQYHGTTVEITLPENASGKLPIGVALPVQAGWELAGVCKPTPVDGFLEYVMGVWTEKQLAPRIVDSVQESP